MLNKENFISIVSNEDLNDLERLILLLVLLDQTEQLFSYSTNIEIAKVLRRHSNNISKSLSSLKNKNQLIEAKSDGKRILFLNEFINPSINNISYLLLKEDIDNNNIFNRNILIEESDEIAEELVQTIFPYKIKPLINLFTLKLKSNPAYSKIKGAKSLKSLFRRLINKIIISEEVEIEVYPDIDEAILNVKNCFRTLFGHPLIDLLNEDQTYSPIEENQIANDKYIRKAYRDKIIDITDKPSMLQEPINGHKLVSYQGEVACTYEGQAGSYCNIIFKKSKNETIYASVKSKHFSNLKHLIDNHIGSIRIFGKVAFSAFRKQKDDVANVIESTDFLDPIEFISESNLVNTNLRV